GGESAAREFYGAILGMEDIPKPPGILRSGGVWFAAGQVELHLACDEDFQPVRRGHPALVVDDIDEMAARCAKGGHAVSWDFRYPGVRRFYVRDSFENRIEIMQRGEAP